MTPALESGATLPPGLTLSNWTLSGTPTALGSYPFRIVFYDSSAGTGGVGSYFQYVPVTVTIVSQPAPTAGAASATVGYSSGDNPITLNITGGTPTSVAVSTQASHGAATASGTSITYKPTAGYAGPDSFTYTATNGTGISAPATVTITVSPPTIIYTPPNPPAGTINVPYSQSIAGASGGAAPYTYAANGSLPTGLILDADGTLHGTPTLAGSFIFKVTATDSSTGTGPFSSALADVVVTINVAGPTISGVAPNSGSTAGGTAVTITGTGFTGATAVSFGGAPATGVTVVSATSITATTPAHVAGAVAVAVTAPGGNASLPNGFTYAVAAPTVASVAPNTGSTAGGTAVTITGTGLTGAMAVYFDGIPATGIAVVNDTTISATTPAFAAGAVTVAVTAPGGNASLPNGFTYVAPAPIISGAAPNTGSTAGGTAVTITGTGFTGATAVSFDGIPATGITVVNDTTIAATTPAHVVGLVVVAVTAPGGTATSVAFTYIIAPTFAFSPVSGPLPAGTAGVDYVQPIAVTGGTAPYTFSASGLPDGMSVDPGTGTLHGLPTTPGAYTIVVTVRDQAGQTGTATYSLALGGVVRPDPTQDAEVVGLLNAQTQTAQRFATTQIGNFNNRLEQLHSGQSQDAQSLSFGLGTPQSSGGTNALGYVEQKPVNDPAGRALGLPEAGADSSAMRPVDALFGDTAFWSGGFVNFGNTSSGTIDIGHTMAGVSGGVDHRFSPDFAAGIGIGYGRDKTDIGANGTESTGQALSAALYGSYHPAPFYLDGMIGVSRLDFDSQRYVTTTGAFANGRRDGTQIFASLSAGYEHRQDGVLLSPYGRLDAAMTQLDGFSETGAGPYNLTVGGQHFDMLAGVIGLRAEYAMPMDWGVLNTRGRLEYTHDFAGSSQASLGYADLGTMPYTLDLAGSARDHLAVGLGLDAKFDSALTLSFDYRTGFDFDGQGQEHTFGIRVGGNF